MRAAFYAVFEQQLEVLGAEVLDQLTFNEPNYFGDMTECELVAELAKRLDTLRPEEAGAALVLRELVKHQRLG